MAVVTTYDAQVTVNGSDLSNHVNKVTINNAQETKEVRVMGTAVALARPGYATPSFDVTFYNDRATTSVESVLRGLVGITATSSGFDVVVKTFSSAILGTSNPVYTMHAVLDGDVNVMDDEAGEIPMITGRFLPYSSFTVSTTTS